MGLKTQILTVTFDPTKTSKDGLSRNLLQLVMIRKLTKLLMMFMQNFLAAVIMIEVNKLLGFYKNI